MKVNVIMGNQCSRFSASKTNQFKKFIEVPNEMTQEVFNLLALKEQINLARTSKRFYEFFSHHIDAAKCLMLVAHGDEDKADKMLTLNPNLLLEPADVTDYSGRRFTHITSYEYAYWAKDWHMCRMLERHMNEAIKEKTLKKVRAMEQDGLNYEQDGERKNSKHFDFTPLITAYTTFLALYPHGVGSEDFDSAWFNIALVQGTVPAYIAQEYCRSDRSFAPIPIFNEPSLPRTLMFRAAGFIYFIDKDNFWFHGNYPDKSIIYDHFGPRFLTVFRSGGRSAQCSSLCAPINPDIALDDLNAVTSLNTVSTAELSVSRANLEPLACRNIL